jgi:hypothetical protein
VTLFLVFTLLIVSTEMKCDGMFCGLGYYIVAFPWIQIVRPIVDHFPDRNSEYYPFSGEIHYFLIAIGVSINVATLYLIGAAVEATVASENQHLLPEKRDR